MSETAATQVPHGLSERDFEPVRDLIDEIRRHDQHGQGSLAKAVVTWQNAFTVFKKLEVRLGLPETAGDLIVYQAIVNDLRASGYRLLDSTARHEKNLAEFGLSHGSLQACLAELEIDDQVGTLRENSAVLAKLDAHFR